MNTWALHVNSEARDCRHILHIQTTVNEKSKLKSAGQESTPDYQWTPGWYHVSLRACKSRTIRGLRDQQVGRRVKIDIGAVSIKLGWLAPLEQHTWFVCSQEHCIAPNFQGIYIISANCPKTMLINYFCLLHRLTETGLVKVFSWNKNICDIHLENLVL